MVCGFDKFKEKKGREIETYTLEFVVDEHVLRNIETHISNFEQLHHFAFAIATNP